MLMKIGLPISRWNLTLFINRIQIRFQINILCILAYSPNDYYQTLGKHDCYATGKTSCKKCITLGLIQNYKLSLALYSAGFVGTTKQLSLGHYWNFNTNSKHSTRATRLNCSSVTVRHTYIECELSNTR